MATADLECGNLSALISTDGGTVLGFWYRREDGSRQPLLRSSRTEAGPLESACFPLVPFGNRLRNNSFECVGKRFHLTPNVDFDPLYLHGDGWINPWTIVEQDRHRIVLRYRHGANASNPYDYEAEQVFALDNERLRLTLSVVNHGARVLPFGLGWHPYFPLTPQTTLMAPARRYWTEGPGHLPVEAAAIPGDLDFSLPRRLPERWINNMFEDWSGNAQIHWPESGMSLEMTASAALRHAMIFRPATDPAADAWFCLEPMSHLADGHAMTDGGGLVQLEPQQSFSVALELHPIL